MGKPLMKVTLASIQIAAAFAYLFFSYGLDYGSGFAMLTNSFFMLQLGAGVAMLAMSRGPSLRKRSPFWIYVAVYLLLSAPVLLAMSTSFFSGNSFGDDTEIVVREMFLASITGAISTWVFFIKFFPSRKPPPTPEVFSI